MADVVFVFGRSNRPLFGDIFTMTSKMLPEITKSDGYPKITVANTLVEKFANGEIRIVINCNLRGKSVYIFETADNTPEFSINDYPQSLYLLIDACRRSSTEDITLVIPNHFYAQQDKKDHPPCSNVCKGSRVNFGKNIQVARIITVDLHTAQIQGFFDIPVDNIFAIGDLVSHVDMLMSKHDPARYVLISPNVGGEKRIESWHKN